MKKFAAVIIAWLLFLVGVQLGIHHERHSYERYAQEYVKDHPYQSGYSQGWMDANCGKGNQCEGGQE